MSSIFLQNDCYTIKNALLWGNCKEHYKSALNQTGTLGSRIVHIIIAIFETIPLIGQIISLFEMFVASCILSSPQLPPPSHEQVVAEQNRKLTLIISKLNIPLPTPQQRYSYDVYHSEALGYLGPKGSPVNITLNIYMDSNQYTASVQIKDGLKWGHIKSLLIHGLIAKMPPLAPYAGTLMDSLKPYHNSSYQDDTSLFPDSLQNNEIVFTASRKDITYLPTSVRLSLAELSLQAAN